MLLCANAALEENKQKINELNVFPVPDGDTGTNMSLTMNSAAIELGRKQTDTVGAVADCAASALLRGARGNSGVILSLLFRGIAKSLKGRETASAAEFAAAVSAGVDDEIEGLRREALRSMPQLFFHGQRDLLAVQRSIAAALRSYLGEHPERRMLAGGSVEEEALVASSTAIGLARTRSMLHVCGEVAPTSSETRRLVMAYLSAGDQA